MYFCSKNIHIFYSIVLHTFVFIFFFIKLSSLKIENKSANLPLDDQVIMIDTVDIGELNNIKLQGKKGSTEKKNVYNGTSEISPQKPKEQKVENSDKNETKSQNSEKKAFEQKEAKEVSDKPFNKEKLKVDKPSVNEQLAPKKVDKPSVNEQLAPKKIDKPSVNEQLAPKKIDKPSINEQLAPKKTDKIQHSKKDTNNIKKDDYEDSDFSSKKELASILKSIEKSKEETKISNVENNTDGSIGKGKVNYDDNYNATIKVLDSIRSKFIKCWTVPIGAKDVEELRVKIHVSLSTTGKVMNAIIYDTYSYNNNPFFRAMADSALRAVYMCSPLTSLPENLYDIWKEVELNFDSRDMI